MEPKGFAFAFDITSDSFVLNVNPSSKSSSNCNRCRKTSPQSKSSSLSPSSNRRSIEDQPWPQGSSRFNGASFWKSLQRNVKHEGFACDITFDSNPSSKSPSNCNSCSKTSPRSKSSSLSLGSNRRSIGDQPCPRGSGRFNGSSFWKSLQRNVKKHMGCFRVVAGRPKDARRALSIKPTWNAVGCCRVRNSEEHEEKLKALILYCKNSYSQGLIH